MSAFDHGFVCVVQKPGLGVPGASGRDPVEDDEMVGRQKDELPDHEGAFLGIVDRRGVSGDVCELGVGFESGNLRADWFVLSTGLPVDLCRSSTAMALRRAS